MHEIYDRTMLVNMALSVLGCIIFFIIMSLVFIIVSKIAGKVYEHKQYFTVPKILLVIGIISFGYAMITVVPGTIDIVSDSYIEIEDATIIPTLGTDLYSQGEGALLKYFIVSDANGYNLNIRSPLSSSKYVSEHNGESIVVEKLVYGKYSHILIYPYLEE